MRLYRDCPSGADVSLDYVNGRWEVLEMMADVAITRRHRFWLIAILDFWTVR